jgi:hypothetical protein
VNKASYLRILERVLVDNNGCWIWQGTTDGRGYGRLSVGWDGKRAIKERTHRIMYMAVHGPIPDGMVVRHKCDVKRCCNPFHLELGTQQQNVQDYFARQHKRHGDIDPPF